MLSEKNLKILLENIKVKIMSIQKTLKFIKKNGNSKFINRQFEVSRNMFYKSLSNENKEIKINEILKEKINKYWSNKFQEKNEAPYFTEILSKRENKNFNKEIEITHDEFVNVIKWCRNWSCPGTDQVYNFYIKYIDSGHNILRKLILDLINNKTGNMQGIFDTRTLLIQKKDEPEEADFRPISLMNNTLKIATKIINNHMKNIIYENNLIDENQCAIGFPTLGTKDAILIDEIIMRENLNSVVAWIDIQKAFDSISHNLLFSLLKTLPIPTYFTEFIIKMYQNIKTNIQIVSERKIIDLIKVKINTGIIQGDSLSPLLFLITMQLVSAELNKRSGFEFEIKDNNKTKVIKVNHMLFVDDLKLYGKTSRELEELLKTTERTLECMNLKINVNKSSILKEDNNEYLNTLKLGKMDENQFYKYLGMKQNKLINQQECKKEIITMIENRLIKIANTELSSVNLRIAFNELCSSLINYTIGIIDWSKNELKELNKILIKCYKKFRLMSLYGNQNRYFDKTEDGGLGYRDFEAVHDIMLCKMITKIETKATSKFTIIEQKGKSIPSTIYKLWENIKNKLKTENNINEDEIFEEEIGKQIINCNKKEKENIEKKKVLHSKFKETINKKYIDKKTSVKWIAKLHTSQRVLANLLALQDRSIYQNIFVKSEKKMCPFCKIKKVSIEHVASRCTKSLLQSYKERHDSICKMIHYNILLNAKFKDVKSFASHKPEKIEENGNGKIIWELNLSDKFNHYNRPDMIFYNKIEGKIFLIEVAITNPDNINLREIMKKKKYIQISRDIENSTGIKTEVLPIVLGWEGSVSYYFKNNLKKLGIENKSMYLQKKCLKETFKICSEIPHKMSIGN